MPLIITVETARQLPANSTLVDPFHKSLHAFVEELPKFVVLHSNELNLGHNVDADKDIILKVVQLHCLSVTPDVCVTINSAFKGNGDQKRKRTNAKLTELATTLLNRHSTQEYTLHGVIFRGQKTER